VSAFANSGSDTEALNARYHAQGSIVRDRDDVFLSLRVTEAATGELVWAERFDRAHRLPIPIGLCKRANRFSDAKIRSEFHPQSDLRDS
jgi:hypothetical protein